jgi:hypothetical protein
MVEIEKPYLVVIHASLLLRHAQGQKLLAKSLRFDRRAALHSQE